MAKMLAISAGIGTALTALAYAIVMTGRTPLTELFLLTGYLVGQALVPLIPERVMAELALQHGGPLVAASALGTWFLVAWAVCFYLVWRVRSNNASLTDTSASPLRAQPGAAKRER